MKLTVVVWIVFASLMSHVAHADVNLAVISTKGAVDGGPRSSSTQQKYGRPAPSDLVRVKATDTWVQFSKVSASALIEVCSSDLADGTVSVGGAPCTSWPWLAAGQVPKQAVGYEATASITEWALYKATTLKSGGHATQGDCVQAAAATKVEGTTYLCKTSVPVTVKKVAAPTVPVPPIVDTTPEQPPVIQPGKAMKWNPGNYAWFSPGSVDGVPGYRFDRAVYRDALLAFLDAIKNEPAVTGILVAGYPRSFEGDTAGDFAAGFAATDAILARAQQYGKHVMFRYETGLFGNYASIYDIYPRYMVDGSGYGYTKLISLFNGVYKGVTARMWQQATMDRAIAVSAAYGARYNGHPAFEMITMVGETSMSVADGVDGFSAPAYSAQIQRAIPLFRSHWPNTGIRIGVNDMANDSNLAGIYAVGAKYGIAFGGPDVWPGDVTQADRLYAGLDGNFQATQPDYRAVVPWAVEAQYQSFMGKWAPEQLWNAMVNGYTGTDDKRTLPPLKAKYIIWFVNESAGAARDKWSTGTLPYLRTVAGKMDTTCPTSYTGGCKAN